jgi:hypothetical protein
MELDSFPDKCHYFIFGIADGDAAGKIRNMSALGRSAFLEDHEVFHRLLLLLLEARVETLFKIPGGCRC